MFVHLEDPLSLGDSALLPRSVHGAVVGAKLVHPLPALLVGYPRAAVDILCGLGEFCNHRVGKNLTKNEK